MRNLVIDSKPQIVGNCNDANTEDINIVLTGDKNYVKPFSVCITSILENIDPKRHVRLFLFTTNMDHEDLYNFYVYEKKYNCHIINISMEKYTYLFNNIDVSKFKLCHVNIVCYFRLLMFKILPDDVEKCFYIDGDMIVETDLSLIYDKMESNKIAAVVVEDFAMNSRFEILSHCYKMKEFYNFQSDPFKYPYFNAGFLLININFAKKENIFSKCIEFINNNPTAPFADQDTLNAVIGQNYTNNIIYLNPEYNVFCDPGINKVVWKECYYNVEILKNAILHPKVYHYAGGNKPWLGSGQNHHSIWVKYLDKSLYYKQKKTLYYLKKRIYLLDSIPFISVYERNTNNIKYKKYYLFEKIPLLKKIYSYERKTLFLFSAIKLYARKG